MIKFRVIKEDLTTNARLGELNLNGKKIKTPVLWLGYMIRKKPCPWNYFNLDTLMVNAYEIIKKKVMVDSIHKFLNFDGIVMMDSGGFQLMKRNIAITPEKVLEIYKKSEPDIGVVLDIPLNPSNLNNREKRWKKTLENTKFMLENSHDIVLMPVIHGYTLEEIKRACDEIKSITDPKTIGVGSLVPIIRPLKASNISKLNGMSSIKFMLDAVSIIRKEFPDAFLHVFGVGSVTTMHLMFSLGVDSVDSMSWRMKAAYGAIQLPGIGDRFISPINGRRQLTEFSLLNECECPVCRDKQLKERIKLLDNSIRNTFYNRAIHNAYIYKEEECAFRKSLDSGETTKFLVERLRQTKYKNLLRTLINNS